MRNEVKAKVDEISSKIMTEGNIEVSSDHNGGSLRIALVFNNAIKAEADKVEEEVRKAFPGKTVFAMGNE